MKKLILFILFLLCIAVLTQAQDLDKIGPITLKQGNPPDSISFILTLTDFNFIKGKKIRFLSSVQIVDADKPWPPRWFVTSPLDSFPGISSREATPLINASVQNGKTIFYTSIGAKNSSGILMRELAYLFCDTNLIPVDTFSIPEKEVDSHDFKVAANDNKLYFLGKDTVLNLALAYNNPADTAVILHYELIQIADKTGKLIFNWDPMKTLGVQSTFPAYRELGSVISNRKTLDWSHGNSLNWDFDGNILYSLKHIGIGKISSGDGHVIWRIDRNKLRPTALSDSLPMFLQHDFQPVKKNGDEEIYSGPSNGDEFFPECRAYQFAVKDSAHYGLIIRVKGAAVTEKGMPPSGGGNYDIEPNGNSLVNFGVYGLDDTLNSKTLFEYRGSDNKLMGIYAMPPITMCYKVHRFTNPKPHRPAVKVLNGLLIAPEGLKNYKWYKLSGPELKTVSLASTDPKFKPAEKGFYCLTVKQGIGMAVSKVVEIK